MKLNHLETVLIDTCPVVIIKLLLVHVYRCAYITNYFQTHVMADVNTNLSSAFLARCDPTNVPP